MECGQDARRLLAASLRVIVRPIRVIVRPLRVRAKTIAPRRAKSWLMRKVGWTL